MAYKYSTGNWLHQSATGAVDIYQGGFYDSVTPLGFTFSAWVRIADASKFISFLRWDCGGGGNEIHTWLLSIMSTDIFMTIWKGSSSTSRGSTITMTPESNRWYHVVGRYRWTGSARMINVGVDGTLAADTDMGNFNSKNKTAGFDAGQLVIGQPLAWSSPSCDIEIADVAIWKTALAQADISALAAGHAAAGVRPESLIYNWPLMGQLVDPWGGKTLSVYNGSYTPTVSAHPRILG